MDRTRFGTWEEDLNGLPMFNYTCREYHDDFAWYFTTAFGGKCNIHYHLIGNCCWFGIVQNHGQVYVLDGRRGFTWVGKPIRDRCKCEGIGLGCCIVRSSSGKVNADVNIDGTHYQEERLFMAGGFKKSFSVDGVLVENMICIPPGDDPVLISEIVFTNNSNSDVVFDAFSCWETGHIPVSKSLIVTWGHRKAYNNNYLLNKIIQFLVFFQRLFKSDTDGARLRHASKIFFKRGKITENLAAMTPFHIKNKKISRGSLEPSGINYFYRPVFLASLNSKVDDFLLSKAEMRREDMLLLEDWWKCPRIKISDSNLIRNRNACIIAKRKICLSKGERQRWVLLFGITEEASIARLILKYSSLLEKTTLPELLGGFWKDKLPHVEITGRAWLSREFKWHAIYFLSSLFLDEFHGLHRIPQGSVYLTGHGFDGAI
ncbi:MAG: hypothetical protein ACTSRA_19665, partial [Promethearchaeota archaeon]